MTMPVMLILLSMWFTLLGVSPAAAEPITILLFGSAFAATVGGWVVSALLTVAATAVFSWVTNALFGPKNEEQSQSPANINPTEVQYGERVSRSGVFGRRLVAGHVMHHNEYANATILQRAYGLADGWCEGLYAIDIDGIRYGLTEIAVSGNNEHRRYSVSGFEGLIDVRFHDGRPGQAADTNLVAQTPGWDSSRRFSGIAYAVVEFTSNKEKFRGIPDVKFDMFGLRTYDVRLDSTAGGSGSHRFNDPSTWTYSANPARCAYHFLRGFYYNGKRMLGCQYSPTDIDLAAAVTAMNVSDESVTRPDGLTRRRYEAHMMFLDTAQRASVLSTLTEAMGGFWTEQTGQISLIAGKAQSTVMTFTDDDLVADEEVEFSPKRANLYTGVQGTYIHSIDFLPVPYTAIIPDEFVHPDGRESILPLDFPQVTDSHQAWLLAKMNLYLNRFQATASVVLDFKDLILEIGDWVVWESANSLRGTRTYRIIALQYDMSRLRMYLVLQEVSALAYSDTSSAADVAQPPRIPTIFGYQTQVLNFGVQAVILEGASGERLPALQFNYDPIIDPAVRGVKIEYRVKAVGSPGDADYQEVGPTVKAYDQSPQDGEFWSSQAVAPGYVYEARAILDSIPGRETPYTDWFDADFATPDMVTVVEVPDDTITAAMLVQELREERGFLVGMGPGTLAQRLLDITAAAEAAAADALTDQMTRKQTFSILQAQNGASLAAIAETRQVIATEVLALAQLIDEVAAEIAENLTAGGLFQITASVDEELAKAEILMKVRAQVADAFSEAALRLTAEAAVGGGTIAYIDIMADRLRFISTSGDQVSIPFKIETIVGVPTVVMQDIRMRTMRSIAVSGSTPLIQIDGTDGSINCQGPFSFGV